MKTVAVLSLATFMTVSAFAGGPACKVVIDYSSLLRSATELNRLTQFKNSQLAAKSMALREAAYGGWIAALAVLGEPYGAHSEANTKAILDEAYLVCDWAKTVRSWCDVVRAAKDGPISSATVAKWNAQMDSWMTQDETLIRSIAEADLPKGYAPPKSTATASKFHAAQ